VIGTRQVLAEARRLPPAGQPLGLQGDLAVPVPVGHDWRQAEQFLGEDAQPLRDVEVGVRHTETDAPCVQAAVPHEIPGKLSEVSGDRIGNVQVRVARAVSLIQHGEGHPPWRTDHDAQLQRHHVARRDVRQALPHPCSAPRFHDLDPVSERALNPVATLRPEKAGWLLPGDEEPGGALGPRIGRDGEVDVLPALSMHIAQFGQACQSAARGHQRVAGKAAGGCEQ
jgi:hypothetical protein